MTKANKANNNNTASVVIVEDNTVNAEVAPTTAIEVLKALDMTTDSVAELKEYMTIGRYKQGLNACYQWCKVGELVSRIKTAKIKGKLGDHVNLVVGADISANERTFSKKMYDNSELIIEWYKESKCSKHNPRTIFEAYDKRNDVPIVRDTKENGSTTNNTDDTDTGSDGAEVAEDGAEIVEVNTNDVMQAVLNAGKLYKSAKENMNKTDIELIKRAIAELSELVK